MTGNFIHDMYDRQLWDSREMKHETLEAWVAGTTSNTVIN